MPIDPIIGVGVCTIAYAECLEKAGEDYSSCINMCDSLPAWKEQEECWGNAAICTVLMSRYAPQHMLRADLRHRFPFHSSGLLTMSILSWFRRMTGGNTKENAEHLGDPDAVGDQDAPIIERVRQVEKCRDVLLSLKDRMSAMSEDEAIDLFLSTVAAKTSLRTPDISIVAIRAVQSRSARTLVLYVNPPIGVDSIPRVLLFADGSVELSLRSGY